MPPPRLQAAATGLGPDALVDVVGQLRVCVDALRVGAPFAAERAEFQEDRSPDARAVIDAEVLDVEHEAHWGATGRATRFHDPSRIAERDAERPRDLQEGTVCRNSPHAVKRLSQGNDAQIRWLERHHRGGLSRVEGAHCRGPIAQTELPVDGRWLSATDQLAKRERQRLASSQPLECKRRAMGGLTRSLDDTGPLAKARIG